MNSQDIRNLQEAYLDVYDEGYKLFPYRKVETKQKQIATDYDSLGKKPLTGKSESEISDTLNNLKRLSNRKLNLGFRSRMHHPDDARAKENKNRGKYQLSSGETTAQRARRDPEFRTRMIKDRMKTMESYDLYDVILEYLLDEGYAETVENAESIMVNMSEDWRDSIVEEKKPLPIDKMKRKERELEDKADREFGPASRSPRNSPERKAALRTSERASTIGDVRRNISTRGGKRQSPMPEVGRYKPEEDEEDYKQYSSGETTAQRARRDPEFRTRMIKDRMKTMSKEGYDSILSYLINEGYADTQEAYMEVVVGEGKVAWDDKKNPNPSGLTPKEKSDAKRKQLGVDNPDTNSFEKGGPGEKEYARHGNLAAAQDKMSKRSTQPKRKTSRI